MPSLTLVTDAYFPRTASTVANSRSWNDGGFIVRIQCPETGTVVSGADLEKLFNLKITDNDNYASPGPVFWRTAPYNYKGVLSFQGVSGMSIGIDIGRLILPKGMRIAARNLESQTSSSFRGRAPGIFNVYASDHEDSWADRNHISWTVIYRNTLCDTLMQGPSDSINAWGTASDSTYTQFTFDSTNRTYQYFTLLVTHKSWNGCSEDSLNFAEWNLFGNEIIQVTPSGFPTTTQMTIIFPWSSLYILRYTILFLSFHRTPQSRLILETHCL